MAKRIPPLNSIQVTNLRPDPKKTIELRDGAVPGLRLRVTPNNVRTWSLSINGPEGKQRRYTVASGVGLAEARRLAEELRRQIKVEGKDPTAEKRAVRARAVAAEQGIGTLNALLGEYFTTGAGAGHRTQREQLLRIRSVFNEVLEKPVATLTTAQLQLIADRHPSKSSAAAGVKYLMPIMRWALKRNYVQNAIAVDKPYDPKPIKQRRLNEEELCKVLPHLTEGYGRACKFLLLTAVRLNEMVQARWHEFDLEAGTWTITGDRRKDTRPANRRREAVAPDHIVQLPRQAITLLNEIWAEREAAIKKYGPIEGGELVFIGSKGGALANWDRAIAALENASGVRDWSAHALRRTTATAAGELGAAPHVVSALLGHKTLAMEQTGGVVVSADLVGRYNKARYAKEVGEALQSVADYYDQLTKRATKLAPLRKM